MQKINIERNPNYPYAKKVVLAPFVCISGRISPKSESENSISKKNNNHSKSLLARIDTQLRRAGFSSSPAYLDLEKAYS